MQIRKDAVTTDNEPATPSNPSETDAASICLNEDNPNMASSMCQGFLGNNANLSNATKTTVYNKLALASLRLKDYEAVVSRTKKSLDIASSPVEYYVAGQANAAQKDWKRAVDEFTAAISTAPKHLLARQEPLRDGAIDQRKVPAVGRGAARAISATASARPDAARRMPARTRRHRAFASLSPCAW